MTRRRITSTAVLLAASTIAAVPVVASARTAVAASEKPATSKINWPTDGEGRAKVIVRFRPGRHAALSSRLRELRGTTVAEFPTLGAVSARVPVRSVAALEHDDAVLGVMADGVANPRAVDPLSGVEISANVVPLSVAAETIGAPKQWREGFTGRGVDVAVIDTGLSPVAGLTGTNVDGSAKVLNGPDISFDADVPGMRHLDGYGHGTHIAGIIAGRDADWRPGDATKFSGIAPDARIVNLKVGAANGAADVTQVIAAMEWVARFGRADGVNVRVVNLSFGTDTTLSWGEDPLSWAANILVANGFVVVAAAGNEGNRGELTSPAMNPNVIAVGAVDTQGTVSTRDDRIAAYSSARGNERTADFAAPGSHLLSLRVPGSFVDVKNAGAGAFNRFQAASGTSQAAAVVSGAAALLVQRYPNASPLEIRALLARTATNINARSRAAGTGEIDVDGAARFRGGPSGLSSNPSSSGSSGSGSSGSGSSSGGSSSGNADGGRGRSSAGGAGSGGSGASGNGRGRGGDVVDQNRGADRNDGADDERDRDVDSGARSSRRRARSLTMVLPRNCDVSCQGKGSLDLARGSLVVTLNGVPLVGSVTPNGNAWTGNAWTGNAWTGNAWTGNAWTGNAWTGNAWTGNAWTGNAWTGNAWTGNAWTGNAWTGNAWTGNAWTGNAWTGNAWTGNAWTGSGWTGSGWTGSGWTGSGWS